MINSTTTYQLTTPTPTSSTSKSNHHSKHIPDSNLVHPFTPPHLMISPQPSYSFNPNTLSPQCSIFNPILFSDPLLHHHSSHSLLYAQSHSNLDSNSSLPHHPSSRPSLGSNSISTRPSSIHIATPTRTRTDSTQSDRTTSTHSNRLRRDSSTHPSNPNPSPSSSPHLQSTQPHDSYFQSQSSKSQSSTNSNSIHHHQITSSTLNHPNRPLNAMVRKPSPLAQGTRSPAPPPGASPAAVPAPSSPALLESKTEGTISEENSEETRSEVEQGVELNTPSTSVDNTSTILNSNPTINLSNPTLKVKPKLGFKLRRALSIGALHDNMIQSSIPESGPVQTTSINRSNTLLSPSITTTTDPLKPTTKAPKSLGGSRRFGILNGRANSSTDNLSISSTVSSASVMIRKLGNLGRNARRNSVMGLTKIFKDSKKENGMNHEEIREEDESKKSNRNGNEGINEEVHQDSSGLTPAAAFILKQKQEYAQREAAAAVANHQKPNSFNGSSSSSKKVDKSMSGIPSSQGEGGSGTGIGNDSNPIESRKKMIEKEKEKLKNKWKWGSSSNQQENQNSNLRNHSSSLTNLQNNLKDEHDDQLTLRGKEVLKEENDDEHEDDDDEREDREERTREDDDVDEYDAESLFGNSVRLPMKEALPKKGILKSVNGESIINRRATFAQNLSVHSTWPPAIYDRRGGPATCNRLTPSLAQRIKEELNAFKMDEMEVHHSSRVHTHFFV